ncbi:hypothetical protein V494_01524 [Pseudogymnoascus sp. VKM F-4513 (FW-928)]|nr:hypothetical protein V494_01524 [Pseudogymnoascus sp. VKM F-4513 (FW-928)]
MASVNERQARSKTGCLVCKTRKVKCDEKPEGCDNCGRLGVQCPGYDTTPKLHKTARAEAVVDIFDTAGVPKKARGSRGQQHEAAMDSNSSAKDQASDGPPNSADDAVAQAPRNWLCYLNLPDEIHKLKTLAEAYFQTVHPLRSLAFIHPPTFMQALDGGNVESQFGSALVHIMFALAARCIKPDSPTPSQLGNKADLPGEKWAKKANDMIFRNLGVPNVQNLMALVLLCEYESRYGQNSTVFMLSGCCFRMAQLLRLNIEPEGGDKGQPLTGIQITARESRRRLMWSCYVLDVVVGSGVESLIMSSKAPLNVQVPCTNDAYLLQKDTRTGYLLHDGILLANSVPAESLGLEAYFVYVISLREQILSSIRSTEVNPPWSEDSRFASIVKKLHALGSNLPSHLKFNTLNSYIHKGSSQQGAFYAMHLAYHKCYCDLYRVVLPGYQFPITKAFTGASTEFIQQCQERSYNHADAISKIFKIALDSDGSVFTEPLCGVFAYESTKIQVIFVTTYVGQNPGEFYNQITENIETNLQTLEKITLQQSKNAILIASLCRLLNDFGFSEILKAWEQKLTPLLPNCLQSLQDTPEFENLHFMATFQQAWKEISWPKPSQHENDDFDGSPITIYQAQTDTNTDENSRLGYQLPPIAETGMIAQESFDIPNTQALTQTTNQYLQMAEEIGDYLTWEPFQIDLSGANSFIY